MLKVRPHLYYLLLGLSCLGILSGCKDNSTPAPVNTTPLIKMLGVSSTSILQFKDSLTITIEFNDGDGDIGETDPDKNDIMVKDSRLSKPDFYFVKPLAPPGSGIRLTGTIPIQLKNTFLLGTGNSETVTFEVRLRDRAGNWSNIVSTPTITIKR